jgi:peptide/nickel transport system substrate-binding protein
MKRFFKPGILLILLLVFGLTTAGVGSAETVFTMAGFYDIPTLDPHATDSGTAENIFMQACENLTRFKPGTSEIVPQLAEKYEVSDDLKTYTFYLRRGIKFTDGAPFDAEAVKINIERTIALGKGPSTRLAEVSEIKVIDDHTVQAILRNPSVTFLYSMTAKAGLHMLSPKALAENKTDDDPWAEQWFSNHIVGTGPYQLVEWTPGDKVILKKNEDYWGGWEGKHIDVMIRRTVPEYTTRRLLLQQGKVDMIDFPPAEDLDNLRAMADVNVVELATINIVWYLSVFTSDVMQNLDLRKALSWAFPYEKAVEIAGMGSVQLQGPMPAVAVGHNDKLFTYHADLEKAKEHLAAAGYKPGELTLTLVHYTMDRNRRIFEIFQSNLAQIGVELKLTDMVWGQFSPWATAPSKQDADLFIVEHWPDFPEATNFITLYFMNTPDHAPGYPRGYTNEKINELLGKAAQTVDPEARNALYRQAQEVIVEEALGIWAFQIGDAVAMKDYVKGFVFTPANFGVYDYYLMSLDK